MKLKNLFSIVLPALALSCLSTALWAQDKKTTEPEKGVLSEEIEVVRPYKPVLANAAKIRRNPDLNDTPPFKPTLTYSILDKKLELNTEIRTLQYQQLEAAKAPILQNNYVKIGGGNLSTSFGEIYINNGRDEALQTGFYAKHLGQKGEINKQENSQQEFGVFGKSIGTKFTLSGDAGYKRLGTYFYGSDPLALINATPDKQQLHLIKLQGELAKQFDPNQSEWAYALKVDAALFKNQLKGSENAIVISALGSKDIGQFSYGLNTSVDFTSVKDQAYDLSNHLLRANPYVKYKTEGFNFNIGMNIVQEFGTKSRFSPLPAISVEAPLVPEYAILFGGISGDIQKTSLNNLSFENPYLDQNINIRNAQEKSNVYAGLKGHIGTGFGFRLTASFKRVDQLPLFTNKADNLSRFEVIYDGGVSQISSLEAEFDVKATEVFNLSAKLQTFNYKLATEAKAWFKPAFRLETQARAQVNQKLNLNASLVLNGETFAKLSNAQPQNQVVTIKSFTDLSVGANYQVAKKWGVYLQANNILGTVYQQYLYYPKFGTNIFGGFSYSF